jgi:hypothetical protein
MFCSLCLSLFLHAPSSGSNTGISVLFTALTVSSPGGHFSAEFVSEILAHIERSGCHGLSEENESFGFTPLWTVPAAPEELTNVGILRDTRVGFTSVAHRAPIYVVKYRTRRRVRKKCD